MKYFHRQVQLWGEETQQSLQDKKIAIIGCGGLGSSLAFALGASGIGEIHFIDFDEVSVHNIHRQIAFKTGDEDKKKCEVVAEVVEARCPFVKAVAHDCDFDTFALKNIKLTLSSTPQTTFLPGAKSMPIPKRSIRRGCTVQSKLLTDRSVFLRRLHLMCLRYLTRLRPVSLHRSSCISLLCRQIWHFAIWRV